MWLAFAALGLHAQASVEDLKAVIVVAHSWRFEVRNQAMGQDPLREAKLQEERGLAQARSVDNPSPHRPAILTDAPVGSSSKSNISAGYVYVIKVKNASKDIIAGIELDYVFTDKNTRQERARLKLSSSSSIGVGKSRTLTFRSISPPTGTIEAETSGAKSKDLYLESVVIQGVRYAQK